MCSSRPPTVTLQFDTLQQARAPEQRDETSVGDLIGSGGIQRCAMVEQDLALHVSVSGQQDARVARLHELGRACVQPT